MVAALMITEEEVRKLKNIFDDVDIDGAGEMDFDEFFEILAEPRTPFTDAIFTIVDDPGRSGIEVRRGLWWWNDVRGDGADEVPPD
jgi:Ca2+-binding EF-hand superfamily protein